MTAVVEVPFHEFEIFIGNGANPEVFEPKCIVNAERGVSISPEYNDVAIPHCDDPLLPSIIKKFATQVSAEMTGSGTVSEADIEFFTRWALSGETKNVRARIGGLQINCPAKLGPFSPSAARDDVANAEISLMSDGEVTITNV